MKEFYFPVRKDTRIHCCQWIPEGKPRGVIQIVHGISEYIARYDALARVFTDHGFVVVGEDHMGHGGSVSQEIPQGCIAEGWLTAVSDSYRLLQMTKEEYPDLPYIIYGHSMGSFMARTLLYTHPDAGLAAAVLSGTGWMPKAVLRSGRAVCLLEGKRKGMNATSSTVDKLMFGSYTKGYENPRTPLDWLTRDEAEVDKYIADPLLGFSASIGLAREMLGGMLMNEDKENLRKMPKNLPVLLVSGDKDPVGSNGKGVRQTWEAFRAAGMQDVRLKLYPDGRHEMHNELNREELHRDVLAFLDEVLSK
ncbi:MAG: lysophospholipase [Oscillospiraceae bacterium]|nr:lysophospholipase [Oscillospiraceae bacterium]